MIAIVSWKILSEIEVMTHLANTSLSSSLLSMLFSWAKRLLRILKGERLAESSTGISAGMESTLDAGLTLCSPGAGLGIRAREMLHL